MGYRDFTTEPTLTTVVGDSIQSFLDELHTAMPARIESYDAATQKADVKPLIKDGFADESKAALIRPVEFPVIPGVPVLFPGAGSFRITWPLNRGDGVLLLFSEVALDVWKNSPPDTVVDPQAFWRHHIADAICVPGLNPFTRPWTGASTSEMTLGVDGGLQVHIGPSGINLGGAGASHVPKGESLNSAIATLGTAIAAAMTAAGFPAQGTAITTAVTAFSSAAAAALSAVVEVQ